MIYIFTALYCEAHIFIKHFDLKKVAENTCFQQFYKEEAGIRLTVSGVGEIAAAAAVGSVCTEYKPKREDFLLNVGICAGIQKQEGIFLVAKLVEQATGKTFYPDLIYRHSFEEESLMTGMMPWTGSGDGNSVCDVSLFDMEAAAVYQSGAFFFGPHQMFFLKIISDSGNIKENLKQHTEQLMVRYEDRICSFIGQLANVTYAIRHQEKNVCLMEEQTEAWIGQLCADMHCSRFMEHALRQHIRYLALTGTDYKAAIQEMYAQGRLPCKDKKEGKLCFEAIKNRLF